MGAERSKAVGAEGGPEQGSVRQSKHTPLTQYPRGLNGMKVGRKNWDEMSGCTYRSLTGRHCGRDSSEGEATAAEKAAVEATAVETSSR